MDRWKNKIALVTGAASGIGSQLCLDLCENEVIVLGLDFNEDRIQKFAVEIANQYPNYRFTPLVCDLAREEEICKTFKRVIEEFGGVDILVNCAGIASSYLILDDGSDENLVRTLQTNLLAVISTIKKTYKSMSERDVEGYIVNISSVAGHCVNSLFGGKPISGTYHVSKFGVSALNRMIGQELVYFQKPKIRISNIIPGLVGTEIRRSAGLEGNFDDLPQLKPKDVSDTMIFILSTPSHVQVRDIIFEPVGQAVY